MILLHLTVVVVVAHVHVHVHVHRVVHVLVCLFDQCGSRAGISFFERAFELFEGQRYDVMVKRL